MDDLAGMISQVLSDPESVRQLQSVAASLGLGGDSAGDAPTASSAPTSHPPAAGPAENPSVGLDLSALSSLLGGGEAPPQATPASSGPDLSGLSALLGNLSSAGATQQQPTTPAQQPAGGVDLSALSGLVQGLTGGQQQSSGGSDLSALTSLLRSGQPADAGQPQNSAPGLPFDMSTLLKLQKAMSSVGANRANIDLLLALKPRLKEHRAKKVDDAIRVMQLIQFLPLIKESGLFGDMENGLGGMLGGLGGSLNGLLGGLLGGNGGGGR